MISTLFWTILLGTNLEFSKAAAVDDGLVVTLNEPKSSIRGHVLKSYNGSDYYAFQDIPYATPPVGNLRFQEPLPHPGWQGILNTTTNTKICTQEGVNGTEDCLILNVFTPVKPGGGKLPVLFWIHGGAFLGGFCSLEQCGPKYFMDYGIILVTIHYRLGAFGFLTTEDGVIPGNNGLKDQLLALKWVNKNIAAFGGDPSQVTIAGQSAGSISVSCHVISKKATGLYRAAIMQSGTAVVPESYVSTARYYAHQLGSILQPTFNGSSSEELLKILQAASPKDLLAASYKVKGTGNRVGLLDDLVWGIVIEKRGKNQYITVPMHESLMVADFDEVPIMIGYTTQEALLFVRNISQVKAAAEYHDKNASSLINEKLNVPKYRVGLAGEQLKKLYTNTTFSQDLDSFVEFSSDVALTNPTLRQASLSAIHVPVYLYQFSYIGSAHTWLHLNITNGDGATHAEELFYMWPIVELTKPADQEMSKTLLTLWSNFVKTSNPTPDSPDLVLGNFTWPSVVDPVILNYVNINSTLSEQTGAKRYEAVNYFFYRFARAPYIVF